jgi:hypothetical protein
LVTVDACHNYLDLRLSSVAVFCPLDEVQR